MTARPMEDEGESCPCCGALPVDQILDIGRHSDDAAVDRFAAAMKAKLKWEREVRGRSGWDDPSAVSDSALAVMLIEHLSKGNPGTFEDIANFAMMLHQRGADPKVLLSLSAEVKGLREALEKAEDALARAGYGRATSTETMQAARDARAARLAALSPIPTQVDEQARATRSAPTDPCKGLREAIPFYKEDLAQLQQVREELRNRWRASAWKLLCRTLDDIEARAAIAKAEGLDAERGTDASESEPVKCS